MAKQFGIVTNLDRCLGCHTCTVGCIMENKLGEDMVWLRVRTIGGASMDTPYGKFPTVGMDYLPIQCMHCDNPTCLKVCPTGAITKREDGIVLIDQNVCIGCQYCVWACPYAAPKFNPQTGTVQKCTLCSTRVDQGLEPFCVGVCTGRARVFGDINDPQSEIAKVIATNKAITILEEQGTGPNISYYHKS
jgi:dimethyl sulfoxide reductase iron-sulfur subunit